MYEKALNPWDEAFSGKIYDERWDDLVRCLMLDNYKIANEQILPIDPTVEGAIPMEDDFSRELFPLGWQSQVKFLN